LVTNMVKEEFKDIELHDGGGLNLMVIRDTQSSRKIDFLGSGEYFFLTFGFKDVQRLFVVIFNALQSHPKAVIHEHCSSPAIFLYFAG